MSKGARTSLQVQLPTNSWAGRAYEQREGRGRQCKNQRVLFTFLRSLATFQGFIGGCIDEGVAEVIAWACREGL
jgi:hypothetical protein